MKSRKQTLSLKSFEAIKTLLESKSISFPEAPPPPIPDPQPEERPDPESEKRLFREAMKDVTPVARKNIVERAIPVPHALKSSDREEMEPLVKLKDLVQHGMGFEIADTPEYIEGTLYQVNPDVASRLHRGDYSIQSLRQPAWAERFRRQRYPGKVFEMGCDNGKEWSAHHPWPGSFFPRRTPAQAESGGMAHKGSLAEMGRRVCEREVMRRWRRGDLCSVEKASGHQAPPEVDKGPLPWRAGRG